MDRFGKVIAATGFVALMVAAGVLGGCEDYHSYFNRKGYPEAVKMSEDPIFPDERRIGISAMARADEGKLAPATQAYAKATNDTDWLVRSTAVRALNQSRSTEALPLIIGKLKDEHPRVRLEAAKALVNMPDDAAVTPLIKIVSSDLEDRDVRLAAAQALGSYKRLDVSRTLVGQLGQRDYGIAFESRLSLRKITGRDYMYDEPAWLEYLTGPGKPPG